MSESVKQRMSRHKQIVIAAIAVSAMLMYAIPAQQAAIAQDFTNDPDQDLAQSIITETNQDIAQDQDIDQDQEQDVEAENEADQSNEATVSQDETNEQSNVLVTGDNTASTTQSGSNTANENSAAAASEGGAGGDVWKQEVKKKAKGGSGGSGGDSSAEANVGIKQSVDNEAVTVQDSSANDNVLSNENTFGDDIAVVDQDNTADQDAVAVGVQDQDATQDQDADQTDFDFNFQYGFQCRADQAINVPFLAAIC